ncbi:MAG: hypothetical protein IJW55_04690 [Clostridia bacterium]|nr:hypothetical protein [Clostridia bacterium]
MDIQKYKIMITETVVTPMLDFMDEEGDCEYTKKDVHKCEELLLQYLDLLGGITAPTDEEILKYVKKLVLALNKLNDKTEYSLIETDARESIWEIIQNSAIECGLQNASEDITEEWREW